MKGIILSIACCCALFCTVFAFGEAGEKAPGAKIHAKNGFDLESMSGYLNLTEEQKAKIKPLLETEAKQLETLDRDSSLSGEKALANRHQIYADTAAHIRQILNVDQQAKFDTMAMRHQETTDRNLERLAAIRSRKSVWVETNLSYLSDQLSLTEDQKPKVKAILQKQVKKVSDYDYTSPLAQYRQNQLYKGLSGLHLDPLNPQLNSDKHPVDTYDAQSADTPDAERFKIWKQTLKQIRPLLDPNQQAKADQQAKVGNLSSRPNHKRKPNAHSK